MGFPGRGARLLPFVVLAVAAFPSTSHANSAGDPLRDAAASRLGVAARSIVELSRAERLYPASVVRVEAGSFLDPGSGGLVTVSVDGEGRERDLEALAVEEAAAHGARHGKLEVLLAEALTSAPATRELSLGVWLSTATLGFDPRLDLASRVGGATTNAEIDAALAASAQVHAAALRGAITAPFAEAAAAAGFRVAAVLDHVPVVFLTGPAALVPWLDSRDEVVSVHLEREGEPELDVSVPTTRADRAWIGPGGLSGAGAAAAVIESGGVATFNPFLPAGILVQVPNMTPAAHATAIAGMVASTHATHRGAAPGASLLSGNLGSSESAVLASADWAIANGANVFNVSLNLGSDCAGVLNLSDRAFDYIVRNAGRMLCKSAGNQGFNASCPGIVTSPGRGYNGIAVGNLDDEGTKTWADDLMNPSSSWLDPPAVGTQKPEVAAPGTNVVSTSTASPWLCVGASGCGSGTSYAAPHVVGTACLLFERDPRLKAWPEALRAILLASAWHNVEGAALFSDRDGAGAIDAYAAVQVAAKGADAWTRGILTNASFDPQGYFDLAFPLVQGNRARVALSWGSDPGGPTSYSNDLLRAKFDLEVRESGSGALVAAASHPFSAFRIADFVPVVSGNYTVRVKRTLFDGTSEPYGIAVSQVFDGATSRLEGVASHPIGATTTMTVDDPYHPGAPYFVVLGLSGASFDQGYALGDRTVPVVADGTFVLPILLRTNFLGFFGNLSPGGTAPVSVVVPNDSGLVGLAFTYSFLTFEAASLDGVVEISPGYAASIVP